MKKCPAEAGQWKEIIVTVVLLREVGHNPLEFGLGETPGGVRAHVSLRGDRQVELHHHFPIRRLDNEQKIVLPGMK